MRFLTENATSNTKLRWTIDKLSGLAWEQAIRNYIRKNNLPLNFRDNNLEVEEIIRSKDNVFFDENGNLLEESNSSSTISFEVGDMFEREGLYGGSYDCKVVARKGNKISVQETWVAEDTGKNVSAITTYDVQVDDEGEYIVIWKYSSEEGRIYAHDVVKVGSRLANNNNTLNENSENNNSGLKVISSQRRSDTNQLEKATYKFYPAVYIQGDDNAYYEVEIFVYYAAGTGYRGRVKIEDIEISFVPFYKLLDIHEGRFGDSIDFSFDRQESAAYDIAAYFKGLQKNEIYYALVDDLHVDRNKVEKYFSTMKTDDSAVLTYAGGSLASFSPSYIEHIKSVIITEDLYYDSINLKYWKKFTTLERIFILHDVHKIDFSILNVWNTLSSLEDIYYEGSEEEWKKLLRKSLFSPWDEIPENTLSNVHIHYNYTRGIVEMKQNAANNNFSEAYSDNINISDIEDVLTAIKDKFPEAHAIYDGDSKEITISLTESKAATNQTELLKSIVKLLYQMDSMILDVDDNETWLTYGVPDGEFTEATAQEAAMNYRDHDWLVCDITDDNVIDVSLFEDFFNLFQRITKNPDYDQNERSFILKKGKMILNQLS